MGSEERRGRVTPCTGKKREEGTVSPPFLKEKGKQLLFWGKRMRRTRVVGKNLPVSLVGEERKAFPPRGGVLAAVLRNPRVEKN